jgi:hypothetical protein
MSTAMMAMTTNSSISVKPFFILVSFRNSS